jgi:hypothetical protein
MVFTLFYISTAIESFLLSAYLAFVGSNPQENLILNLSASRLAVVTFFLLIGLGFVFLAIRSPNPKSRQYAWQENFLNNEGNQWSGFIISLMVLGLSLFLLTRQLNFFGDFKQIYERFEPALVWLSALGTQAAFLIAVWYFAYFVTGKGEGDRKTTEKELLPLIGLYVVFVIFKLVFITRTSYGPVARGDEMTYYDMADALYRGYFSIAQTSHYPPLYPLSFVVAMVFKIWTFDGIKLLNAIYSSSIVFPVYFISRRFLNARYSLAAAFLSCLIPFHLVFPRRIVSENLYFPLFLWTLGINLTAPRTRSYRIHWDILTGIMIGVLYLTRYITLAAIPFFLIGWWIKPFEGEAGLFKPGWKKIINFCLLIAVMLITFSPWLIGGLIENVPLKLILGFGVTSRVHPEAMTLARFLTWMALYASYFILVAAPVMHLLIVSFFQIDYKRWREGFGLWVFQVLLIMGGFYAAVTRHSWRAYYNAVIPSYIMGRYLILFSVIFFTIALVTISQFRKDSFRNKWQFILLAQLLPLGLVLFAYLAIIKVAIFPTDGELLKSLGSVDAYFTEMVGGYFFLILFLIYGITNWLMWQGSIKPVITALVAGLVVYYSAGIPGYYQSLIQYQTYPWLASQIARLAPQPDLKTGDYIRISVFMPQDRTDKNEAEIYNGLRIRGINKTIVEINTPQAVDAMTTNLGYIIERLDGAAPQAGQPVYRFNNQQFEIIPVQKP